MLPVATGGKVSRCTRMSDASGTVYEYVFDQNAYNSDINIPTGNGSGTFRYTGENYLGGQVYELSFSSEPENISILKQSFGTVAQQNSMQQIAHILKMDDPGSATVSYDGNNDFRWEMRNATLVVYDETAPTVYMVWSSHDTYTPGMGVPLFVQFSEAVQAEYTSIKLNGKWIPALTGTGLSNIQVFVYPVGELDATSLRMTGYYTKDAFGNIGDSSAANFNVLIDGVSISTPDRKHTFTGISATVNSALQNIYTIDVSADISNDPGMTTWLLSEIDEDQESGKAQYKGLFYSLYIPGLTDPDDPSRLLFNGGLHRLWDLEGGLEGAVTGGRLCSQIQIDLRSYFSEHTEPLECVFALYYGSVDEHNVADVEPIFGKTCCLTINPPKLVTQNDMKIRITVDYSDPDLNDIDMTFPRDGQTDLYRLNVNLAGNPTIRARVVLNGDDFTFGDTAHTTIYDPAYTNGRTLDKYAHFLWALDGGGANADDYAHIDEDGYIYPTGTPGYFFVVACAMGGYAGRVPSTFGNFVVVFDEGYSPYLSIPNASKEINVISGSPANIYWNSNIIRKSCSI